jgi:hypothetical protein
MIWLAFNSLRAAHWFALLRSHLGAAALWRELLPRQGQCPGGNISRSTFSTRARWSAGGTYSAVTSRSASLC